MLNKPGESEPGEWKREWNHVENEEEKDIQHEKTFLFYTYINN